MLIKIITFLALIAFGIFMIIFGGYDDSPGAQGIGVFSIILAIIILIKIRKKISKLSS